MKALFLVTPTSRSQLSKQLLGLKKIVVHTKNYIKVYFNSFPQSLLEDGFIEWWAWGWNKLIRDLMILQLTEHPQSDFRGSRGHLSPCRICNRLQHRWAKFTGVFIFRVTDTALIIHTKPFHNLLSPHPFLTYACAYTNTHSHLHSCSLSLSQATDLHLILTSSLYPALSQ